MPDGLVCTFVYPTCVHMQKASAVSMLCMGMGHSKAHQRESKKENIFNLLNNFINLKQTHKIMSELLLGMGMGMRIGNRTS